MKRTLFDDDSDGESGKEVKLTTNKEFAKKYENKKKREELAQCLFKAISFSSKPFPSTHAKTDCYCFFKFSN